MSKPNLLFYANKLGGREIGLIFLCSFVGRTRFFLVFVEFLGMNTKGGCNMNLKMKYIILYVEKFEECLRFYKDTLQLPIKAEHGTYIEFNTWIYNISDEYTRRRERINRTTAYRR